MLEKVKINEIINLGILLWGLVDGIFKLGFEFIIDILKLIKENAKFK